MKKEPVQRGWLFARLLSDIMIPPPFSAAIRAQGYDVAEVRALANDIQRDDRSILNEATRQKRVVMTCNYSDRSSNFCLIHEECTHRTKGISEFFLFPRHKLVAAWGVGRCVIGCSGF